ncbi:MAG: DUF4838 domain-containing protein [Armatimonadetes bacterium]|nr:DUF4838 domain-containing protein [Armatimonadota bacterium]
MRYSWILFVLAWGWTAIHAGAAVLVKDGQPRTVIMLPAKPSEAEAMVARDFQRHIALMSGTKLPIIRDGNPSPKMPLHIWLGKTRAGSVQLLSLRRAARTDETGLILARPGSLILTGVDDRGTSHAVYTLLERLGCRWYLPWEWGTVVPQKRTVSVPHMRQIVEPRFTTRAGIGQWGFEKAPKDPSLLDWGRRNRVGGYAWWGAGHSYDYLVPPSVYFKDHPEYYALRDGQRSPAQLCTTNSDVIRIATATVRKVLKDYPGAHKYICVSPNDNNDFCQCEKCRAADPQPGYWTDRILLFANEVARAVREEAPQVYITFYSDYHNIGPPLEVRPEKNIMFWITQWGADLAHPAPHPNQKRLQNAIRDFGQFGNPMMMYTYYGHYNNFVFFPIVHCLKADMPYYYRRGIHNIYSETHQHWATQGLNFYIYARLAWDPSLDVDKIMEEFYTQFFGPAREPMKRYFEMAEDTFNRTGSFYGLASQMPLIFTEEYIRKAGGHIARAKQAVESAKPEAARKLYRQRVGFFAQGFEISRLYLDACHLRARFIREGNSDLKAQAVSNLERLVALLKRPENEILIEKAMALPVIEYSLNALKYETVFAPGDFSYPEDFDHGGNVRLQAARVSGFEDGTWCLGLPAGAAGEVVYHLRAKEGSFSSLKVAGLISYIIGSLSVDVSEDGQQWRTASRETSPDSKMALTILKDIDLTSYAAGKPSLWVRFRAESTASEYQSVMDQIRFQGRVE